MENESHLLEFYGRECPHCQAMDPLILRLKEEEGIEIAKYEVWHSEKNAALMKETDQGQCGGVPFFYNKNSAKWMCGGATYEKFKEWALGK